MTCFMQSFHVFEKQYEEFSAFEKRVILVSSARFHSETVLCPHESVIAFAQKRIARWALTEKFFIFSMIRFWHK